MAKDIIGYSGGTFDCLHVGHIHFLTECKKYCDTLVISLNTDDFIFQYKGKLPVFSYDERRKHLMDSGLVDGVVPNEGGHDSKPAIEEVNPSIILIGSDWAVKDYYKQMDFTQKWLDDRDIVLAYIPYYKSISTSEIKKRINAVPGHSNT